MNIFFFFFFFFLAWDLYSLFSIEGVFKSHLKNHPYLKCQFPPKIPIWLKSLLYKRSEKWLSPPLSPRMGDGGGCKLWIWIWVLDVVGTAYSRKKGHACEFSEKGQKRAKYLKIWPKMYKMWKYFEKGQLHIILA